MNHAALVSIPQERIHDVLNAQLLEVCVGLPNSDKVDGETRHACSSEGSANLVVDCASEKNEAVSVSVLSGVSEHACACVLTSVEFGQQHAIEAARTTDTAKVFEALIELCKLVNRLVAHESFAYEEDLVG